MIMNNIFKITDLFLDEIVIRMAKISFFKNIRKGRYSKLLEFINANNILYEKQFGFHQRHATSHAIMTLVEKVTKA